MSYHLHLTQYLAQDLVCFTTQVLGTSNTSATRMKIFDFDNDISENSFTILY